MSEATIYVRVRGRISGPFSMDHLKTMRKQGRISRVHEVSEDGVHWRLASTLSGLFPETEAPQSGSNIVNDARLTARVDEKSVPAHAPSQQPQWHYATDNQQHGPVTFGDLQHLASKNVISPNDSVWQEGMDSWVRAGDVPGLRFSIPSRRSSQRDGHAAKVPPRTSGMAVAGLICSIFGVFLVVVAIPGLILSHVALKDIYRSQGSLDGKGIAVSGIILGWIGLIGWTIWMVYSLKVFEGLRAL